MIFLFFSIMGRIFRVQSPFFSYSGKTALNLENIKHMTVPKLWFLQLWGLFFPTNFHFEEFFINSRFFFIFQYKYYSCVYITAPNFEPRFPRLSHNENKRQQKYEEKWLLCDTWLCKRWVNLRRHFQFDPILQKKCQITFPQVKSTKISGWSTSLSLVPTLVYRIEVQARIKVQVGEFLKIHNMQYEINVQVRHLEKNHQMCRT